MKQTNDKAIIRLLHIPTKTYVDWNVSRSAIPSVHYIHERAEAYRKELNSYLEANDLDLDSDKDISKEHILKISQMNEKIISLRMDALSCVLDPVEPIPAGYDNKREYLEQCIASFKVIPEIMAFFSKLSNSSTGWPEGSLKPVQFLDQAGQPWDFGNTKELEPKESSTD